MQRPFLRENNAFIVSHAARGNVDITTVADDLRIGDEGAEGHLLAILDDDKIAIF